MEKMKNKNASESNKGNPTLPYDVIMYDILTRVPMESLVRFTCVCKPWHKLLLTDKRFANLHQTNNSHATSSSKPPGVIFCEFDKETRECYLSLSNVEMKKRKIVRFNPETDCRADDMHISQSFNGLLLFFRCVNQQNCVYDYIVYNPITGRSVSLPIPDSLTVRWGIEMDSSDFNFCLGYDPVGKIYKAVCFGGCDNDNFCTITTLGECGADCWRNLANPGFSFTKPIGHGDHGVLFSNGVLYWKSCATRGRNIYSLDVSTETLYTTEFPNDACRALLDWGSCYCDLTEMGGLLCYYELHHMDRQVKLWVLKKNIDNNQFEWERKRNIELAGSFQNAARVVTYGKFMDQYENIKIVTNPKLKIIFSWYRSGPKGGYEYYSCDVESNKIELILGPTNDGKREWHVNSLAYI